MAVHYMYTIQEAIILYSVRNIPYLNKIDMIMLQSMWEIEVALRLKTYITRKITSHTIGIIFTMFSPSIFKLSTVVVD